MKIYRYPSNLASMISGYKGCVLTFGNFDGLHIGHQKLISKINNRAKSLNLNSVLINFYPHPLKVIKGIEVKSINSFREKSILVEKLNINYLYMHRFNEFVRNLNAAEFLDNIIDKLKPHEVYVGEDASIGANREGDVNFMSSYFKAKNIYFEAIDFISTTENNKVSSSDIRNHIMKGNFSILKSMFGREYSILGKVERGKQLARKLNFKTANINCKNRLTPKHGVYISKTKIDGKSYNSISNLGVKPTFGSNYSSLETHIFDYNSDDFYGKEIEVVPVKFLRDEIKFNNPSELEKQIKRDCEVAKAFHDEQN